MKKVVIKTDNGEKEVELNNPKGKHTKKGFKLLTSIQGEDGNEDLGKLNEYTDYIDEVAAEMTGMTIDKLDELEDEEKNKIVGFYHEKVKEKLDFLKSSLSPENSAPKAKKG